MKILHVADLHLDSKISSYLDKEKAKERRYELINSFTQMVEYARNNNIEAILICGDLFDTSLISSISKDIVIEAIIRNPDICFFYLRGNHDEAASLFGAGAIPDNLYLFDNNWTSYAMGENDEIVIHGVELTNTDSNTLQTTFTPNPNKINIVMLHGQEAESFSNDKTEVINFKAFRNKGINYLALGHVHAYKRGMLDAEAVCCYSGCLEPRGFDEPGVHGFVILDINEKKGTIEDTFVPFAKRRVFIKRIDVTDCNGIGEISIRVKDTLSQSKATINDIVRVELCGDTSVESDIDVSFIMSQFENTYYYFDVVNKTSIYVDYRDYMLDESLKGEFVRLIGESDLPDKEKADVIKIGLDAIIRGKLDI